MYSLNPTEVAGPGSGIRSGRRRDITMPGVNEHYTSLLNKRIRPMQQNGPGDKDTQQGVISTTSIMLAPPQSNDPDATREQLCAPPSTNPLANHPSRGDWAMHCAEDYTWQMSSVSSGLVPQTNALCVFTNMGGVPKDKIHLLSFAGIVGNPSKSSTEGNDAEDNFGNIYSAGVLCGANTGPASIPAQSAVYASAIPLIQKDAQGHEGPGYMDKGWVASNIDKYLIATYALRDTDVCALFMLIRSHCDQYAEDTMDEEHDPAALKTHLSLLAIHPHIPAAKYAEYYYYVTKMRVLYRRLFSLAEALMNHLMNEKEEKAAAAEAAAVAARAAFASASSVAAAAPEEPLEIRAMKLLFDAYKLYQAHAQETQNFYVRFWGELEKKQSAISKAMGGPEWDSKLSTMSIVVPPFIKSIEDGKKKMDPKAKRADGGAPTAADELASKTQKQVSVLSMMGMFNGYNDFQKQAEEALLLLYADHNNWMRKCFMGKARYSSPPGGSLDLLAGYRMN